MESRILEILETTTQSESLEGTGGNDEKAELLWYCAHTNSRLEAGIRYEKSNDLGKWLIPLSSTKSV